MLHYAKKRRFSWQKIIGIRKYNLVPLCHDCTIEEQLHSFCESFLLTFCVLQARKHSSSPHFSSGTTVTAAEGTKTNKKEKDSWQKYFPLSLSKRNKHFNIKPFIFLIKIRKIFFFVRNLCSGNRLSLCSLFYKNILSEP